ncbi:MAG TPA: type II toxin-antitoxin system death-on-curing family toxin [Roseimicrobium sp.]|nr:type II toxin-antitoxin system death-on-curing family toxin [Roseimicrobium sp.]
MTEPRFLTVHDVEILHRRSIERYGGTLGIRDKGGIESAVGQPQNVFFYGQGDLFDMAAAYAFHIAQAQAFLDGNKRTAVLSAFVFLESNGIRVQFSEYEIYEAMIGIAERRVSKSDLAALMRKESGGNRRTES